MEDDADRECAVEVGGIDRAVRMAVAVVVRCVAVGFVPLMTGGGTSWTVPVIVVIMCMVVVVSMAMRVSGIVLVLVLVRALVLMRV